MPLTRRLALALLLPVTARADLADPVAAAIAANPALAELAARDPVAARSLAAEAAALLAAPPGELRSATQPSAADQGLLRGNPLLGAVYRHDPAAALDLLARVKQAGGTRR